VQLKEGLDEFTLTVDTSSKIAEQITIQASNGFGAIADSLPIKIAIHPPKGSEKEEKEEKEQIVTPEKEIVEESAS